MDEPDESPRRVAGYGSCGLRVLTSTHPGVRCAVRTRYTDANPSAQALIDHRPLPLLFPVGTPRQFDPSPTESGAAKSLPSSGAVGSLRCDVVAGTSAQAIPANLRKYTGEVPVCHTLARMMEPTFHSWDPDAWEAFGMLLLRQRYGVGLVPVPDKSGGDGGLDAFTPSGVAWQCYAPENEPLKPIQRYVLQRGKITTDLGKLKKYKERVAELLGSVVLTEWVLLTPKNESADLVAHCATKTGEVLAWGLDFIAPTFRVYVQTLDDFAVESKIVQAVGYLPHGLHRSAELPEFDESGTPFSSTMGPNIEVMDGKLKAVMPNDSARAEYRGEMLKSQIAGEDHLAKFEDHLPDVAAELRAEVALAKRRMLMDQATGSVEHRQHLLSVEADIIQRVTSVVPELRGSAAEIIAQAAITRWLQECTMSFDAIGEEETHV